MHFLIQQNKSFESSWVGRRWSSTPGEARSAQWKGQGGCPSRCHMVSRVTAATKLHRCTVQLLTAGLELSQETHESVWIGEWGKDVPLIIPILITINRQVSKIKIFGKNPPKMLKGFSLTTNIKIHITTSSKAQYPRIKYKTASRIKQKSKPASAWQSGWNLGEN